MRRKLEDWENAEDFVTPYSREQVARFSPRSLAILEIQSKRDLEILEKIYSNSVLLGDDGPDGWGIQYAREFDMTNDSKLFPPRPKWEADGYRPDEYSRWLKGNWRPIEELWIELSVDAANPRPAEIELEEWLFNTNAGLEERTARIQYVYGHLFKPGDVQRTAPRIRCAQPPYDSLPIPRADIPAGIILSREADAWIKEEQIEDTALPLYEGRMIGQFDFSQKGWVSGKGRSAVWRDIPWDRKQIEPQYLLPLKTWQEQELSAYLQEFAKNYGKDEAEIEAERLRDPDEFARWWWPRRRKSAFIDVTSATNTRTMFSTALAELPCGNSAPVLKSPNIVLLPVILNSFTYDTIARFRCGGLHLNWFVIEESAIPQKNQDSNAQMTIISLALGFDSERMAEFWITPANENIGAWKGHWGLSEIERLRLRCIADSLIASRYCLSSDDLLHVLHDCDLPASFAGSSNPKGFWRVDKDKDPELRHTVLTLVAFHDLEEKIRDCGGDRAKGIEAFLNQNDGKGWMLPETLRLADYGLGHDERAKHPQPIASRLGPRFYDWQLAQSPEESWRECHLHARNLLGEIGYLRLLEEIESPKDGQKAPQVAEPSLAYSHSQGKQGKLFE